MWVLKLRILPFVCSNVAREGIKLHRAWGFSEDFRLFNKELPHLGGIHGLLYSFGAFFGTTAMAEQRYCVDYARRGMAGCKKCKEKITKGLPRIGKIIPNPFSDGGGDMKEWYHIRCVFEKLERSRPNTKRIEALSDLEGNEVLEDSEKELILQLIKDLAEKIAASPAHRKAMQSRLEKSSLLDATVPSASAPRKFSGFSAIPLDSNGASKPGPGSSPPAPSSTSPLTSTKGDPTHKDSSFREFRKLCALIAEQASYNSKTQIVHDFIRKGTGGDGFRGDVYLTMKMLLPGVVKSVYNVSDKQLVKLFSRVFNCNHDDMVTDLEKGDVPETVRLFFEASKNCPCAAKSHLSLQEVDVALTQLSQLTKEEEQQQALHDIASRCTSNDLKCIVRLIKHDLRMNAGAKHILDGLDPNAYEAFKASRDLRDVVDRVLSNWKVSQETTGASSSLTVSATLMIPVQPMLAEACKSVEYAMKKCPNGMYSEIKYDGERVQVHKKANEFQYYSRSLKPVLPHKVAHFKDYIPQAFPGGDSLIIDAEVLLIDCKTSQPLPFGSLGIHKKAAFRDANVCLFVFDCIYFNGQSLMDRPIKERRKFLHENMIEIPNHVLFSEMQHVTKAADLAEMITRVIREGLEGLVLKDVMSVYEPGKRHWLKVKKDYLHSGAMADTADLVVLGAYYGHGSKGGIMSVFLMGCYDPALDIWCTVSKCGIGLDDATLARLQNDLDMVKISKDPKKIPGWLKINKNYYPDFISLDPKNAPVWEITGAEFSKAEAHTAGGISIRFPRVTRFRDDKDWQTATNLPQLQTLFSKSKEKFVATELLGTGETSGSSPSSPSREGRTDNKQIAGSRGTKAGAAAPAKARSRKAVPVKADPGKAAAVKANPKKNVIEKMQSIKETTRSAGVKRKVEDKEPEQTLLDIFSGVRLFLPSTVEGYEQARRYFVAYNGDLVPDHELATATHVVGRNAGEAQPVTIDWVWKCIKRRKVVLPC